MQAQLQRVEIEAARGGDDDLAVEHAALRQPLEQRVVQLGKVAIERTRIAALDEELRAAVEYQRAEFAIDQVAGTVLQEGLVDTMSDLLLSVCGAALFLSFAALADVKPQ